MKTSLRNMLGRMSATKLVAIGIAVVVIVVGAVYLTSHASGAFAAVEPDAGKVSSNASVVADANASNGKAVLFSAPVVGGGGGGNTGSTCALPKYPDATCTGIPAGTALTTVSGDLTVTTDNAVVSGKDVNGCIEVAAVGVTVKNSKAKCIETANSTRARDPANPRLTIQDSEVDCGNKLGSTAIGDRNINVYRTNIHGCENGFDMDSDSIIQDSYIHDLFNSTVGDPHTDGLQSGVGSNLTINHNTFYGFDAGCKYPNNGSCNGTSAVNIFNAPSGPAVHDTTVSNNLLAGGAYTLYCPRVSTTNFKITNNHFSTIYSPHVGEYGPSSDCSNETQSGNVYQESGAPLNLE